MSTANIKSGLFFSDRLQQLRGDRSRAEFARQIGVSSPLYFKWERGSIPGGDKLKLIAQACGVSVEWLLSGDPAPVLQNQTNCQDIDGRRPSACRYPEGCDLETELGQVKERLSAMEGQLDTVIRLLGASLRMDEPVKSARKVG